MTQDTGSYLRPRTIERVFGHVLAGLVRLGVVAVDSVNRSPPGPNTKRPSAGSVIPVAVVTPAADMAVSDIVWFDDSAGSVAITMVPSGPTANLSVR